MIFRQLFDYETYTYTYLIASDIGREGVLIDPVKGNTEQYLKLIDELNLKLVYAIDTHVHADHITALGELGKQTGCETVLGQETKAEFVSLYAKEGTPIKFGDLTIEPIYTPGHTDDSYCYLMDDRIFTGDTLLIRGTGRTDFQNGSASDQYDSIFKKILTLPDNTLVFPGHDYNGMTMSTIAEEKSFNPRLQVENKAAYIELMDNLNLANPKFMDIAVPANLKLGLE
jgi:glyoxylase-like metal-dependent hydrolase (beta-lactamase superfamily II)